MTGRRLYNPEVHPELLLGLMQQGKHQVHFLNFVKITRATYYSWVEKYPEFAHAHDLSEALAYDWWLDLGIQNADNDNWDNTVWKYTMNTRFRPFTQGVYLKGFKKLKDAKEQHKVLLEAATHEQITPKEANQICDLVEAGQRIVNNADLLARIEALEKRGLP